MKELKLNGTKIMYHPRELAAWADSGACYPIQVEISPTNQCNHKCVFCAYDYISRSPSRFLDSALLIRTITELRGLGTKSLFYSGEGEPLLHKGLPDIVEKAQALGFSQALNTNGVLMRGERLWRILPALDWVRVSFNAPTAASYQAVHRCHVSDYERVLRNIAGMTEFAARQGLSATVGVQMVYMGQSTEGLRELVVRLRDSGAAYFSLKRFNQHPAIQKREFAPPDAAIEALHELSTDTFKVAVRDNIDPDSSRRKYNFCYGMAFYAEIISNGDVYSCGPHLGNPAFCYGNISESRFKELWSIENRAALHERIAGMGPLDALCMPHCRIHEINNFLWELRHPPAHVNFI